MESFTNLQSCVPPLSNILVCFYVQIVFSSFGQFCLSLLLQFAGITEGRRSDVVLRDWAGFVVSGLWSGMYERRLSLQILMKAGQIFSEMVSHRVNVTQCRAQSAHLILQTAMVFLLVFLTVLHLVTLAMLLIATLEKVGHAGEG